MEIDEKYIDKNKILKLKEIHYQIKSMVKYRNMKLIELNPLILTTEFLPKDNFVIVVDFDNKETPPDIDTVTKKFINDIKDYFKANRISQIKALIVSEDYIEDRHKEVPFSRDYFNKEYLRKNPDNQLSHFKKYFLNSLSRSAGIRPINYISENIYKRYDNEVNPPKEKTKSCLAKRVLSGLIEFRDQHPDITDYLTEIDKLHMEELIERKKKNRAFKKNHKAGEEMEFDEYKYCSKTGLRNYLNRIMNAYNKRYPNNRANNVSDLFRKLPSYWMDLTEITYNID